MCQRVSMRRWLPFEAMPFHDPLKPLANGRSSNVKELAWHKVCGCQCVTHRKYSVL